jgi:hypothetical protein
MPIRGVLEFAAPAGGPDPDAKLAQLLEGLEASPDDAEVDPPNSPEMVPTGGS